ncbi:MAG TPA: hypothetical protein V6C88_02575 [Chroococcidiopsis sp.]
MTVELPPSPSQAIATLTEAAIAYRQRSTTRPSPEAIASALVQAEKDAKQQRLTLPFEALCGRWRLCFSTGVRKQRQGGIALGKGFYLPSLVPAYITFTPASPNSPESPSVTEAATPTIQNQIQLAGVRLTLTGPCRYLGKKNLLAFDFTHMQVAVLGGTVYDGGIRGGAAKADAFPGQAIAKLPFFAFFCATPDLIAARGRGGGLALWIRES